ncbi:MAG: CRTAC1 family protein [Deltaproteobacteria bacterium]|nr:CRTAC1 family protein [Deltaproteobacteria bacterium]
MAIADFDGQGLPDVFVTSPGGANGLFLNRGGLRFENAAAAWGAALPGMGTLGASAADVDGDGDPDLLVAGRGFLDLLRNDGDRFTPVGAAAGFVAPRASRNTNVALADYDRDGWLDAYVTSWFVVRDVARTPGRGDPLPARAPHLLLRGRADGTFADMSELLPLDARASASFGATWSDFDQDGDADLYVSNDFGHETVPSQLYRNDGSASDGRWRFTPIGDECGCRLRISGMSGALADFDRDGFQDLYQTNILFHLDGGQDGEHLLRNLGGLVFEDATARFVARAASFANRRAISWGAEAIDVDNDGWVDLFVPFGHFPPSDTPDIERQPNALLLNQEGRRFLLAGASGVEDDGWGRGAGVVDLDLDGCLDLVVANMGGTARAFRNRCEWGSHWVQLMLVGTRSNHDAVGAVARVWAGGAVWRDEVVAGSTSVHSSRWKALPFGLGRAAAIERLEVEWPSGAVRAV